MVKKYGFIIMIIIGLILIYSNMFYTESNFNLILWGIGILITFIGVLFFSFSKIIKIL